MGDRNIYRNPTGQAASKGGRIVLGERNFAILASDLTLNRTIGVAVAPKNFVVTGIRVTLTDIDTNATPTHAFTIGDAASANRLVTTATTGQAGGTTTTLAATGDLYKFPDETEILFTTTVASATAAAGTGTVLIEGFQE